MRAGSQKDIGRALSGLCRRALARTSLLYIWRPNVPFANLHLLFTRGSVLHNSTQERFTANGISVAEAAPSSAKCKLNG